ncbi:MULTISPECIES: glycosyltransferase [unclassified Micromonospora]|uniref:glycosyltransferase n=1 Tax=unclassified Micromonospora TaxID=2617518 RepID=UPI0033197A4A
MRQVLLLGMYRFPHGDAPANRILSLAKTFREAGFAPFVIGNGVYDPRFLTPRGRHEVDGLPFTSVRDRAGRPAARILARLFQGLTLARAVRRHGVDRVELFYTTQGTLTLSLVLMCRFVWRRPLIVDCMEWHEPSQFRWGRLSPRYLQFVYKFHLLCRRGDMVTVTRLVAMEMARRHCRVIRIPPQVDVRAFPPHRAPATASRIEVFYAGTPQGKDDLGTVLRGLGLLQADELSRVRLTVAGPSPTEVTAIAGGEDEMRRLGGAVRCLGRISRADVLDRLAESHFTVLLRPVTTYSAAGFPSKVPESLAAGACPIVNLTSDLGEYLTDGENAVVVEACSAEAFATALRRVISLSPGDLVRMSRNARTLADTRFDYRAWAAPLGRFVDELTARGRRAGVGSGRSVGEPAEGSQDRRGREPTHHRR